jgi:transposase
MTICESNKQPVILACPRQPSVDGVTVESCTPSAHQLDIVALTPLASMPTQNVPQSSPINLLSSCTAECPAQNSERTSNVNKTIFEVTMQSNLAIRSSNCPTSPQDSISSASACSRFWDESKKEAYDALSWLPKIDWQDLHLSSSNISVSSITPNSWFSSIKISPQARNSDRTCSPLYKFTVADGTANGGMRKQKLKAITKMLKLRLNPSSKQKELLEQWAGTARFTYNKTLAALQQPKNCYKSWMTLRNRFVTAKSRDGKDNTFVRNKPWLLKTPKSVRVDAVREAVSNRKACFTNLKQGNITHFSLGFKAKRHEKRKGWSLGIEKNNVTKQGDKLFIFKELLGEMRYRSTKQLHKIVSDEPVRAKPKKMKKTSKPKPKPNSNTVSKSKKTKAVIKPNIIINPAHDCRIQKDRFGDYYMLVPHTIMPVPAPSTHSTALSCDPGVAYYVTAYDPAGAAYKLGVNASGSLLTKLEELDHGLSRASKLRGRRLFKQTRRNLRMRKCIHYMKRELHNQVNNFLTKNTTLLLYPKLESQRLAQHDTRSLTTKETRKMMNLGHCGAFVKLRQKCLERGVRMIEPNEAYTTKTCPLCGRLNECDRHRMYHCHACNYHVDRDLHGSANVLLKYVHSFRVLGSVGAQTLLQDDEPTSLAHCRSSGLEGQKRCVQSGGRMNSE